MHKPRVCIVTPAAASANNGNWHTAARWQRFLAAVAQVRVLQSWDGGPDDALIALHARRSADSVARFHAARPAQPLAVVLTGTDLYRDLETDASAQHSLQCASHLVVLQPRGLLSLPLAVRAKARSIVQSATRVRRTDRSRRTVDFVAVGHLRDEKDPLTLMRAARLLGDAPGWRIVHIGGALDEALAEQARRTAAEEPRYRWLNALPAPATRRWIARAHALVHMSRLEGGANAVIEAVRSGVPVLASRIDGNLGLLGDDYEGVFPAGDAEALAALMRRFLHEPAFAERLRAQCAAREQGFTPAAEAAAVRGLLHDMLRGRDMAPLPQSPPQLSTA
jgi:putative glycosyltransferase (TIGR04348 family)